MNNVAGDKSAIDNFLGARDFLLTHRTDYVTAYRDFAWLFEEDFAALKSSEGNDAR